MRTILSPSSNPTPNRQELTADTHAWPTYNQLRQRLTIDPGGVTFVIDGHVTLDSNPETLAFVAFLRDCMSWRCNVIWAGHVAPSFPTHLLTHLPPPITAETDAVAQWQHTHQYGQLYWRQAPMGIHIFDHRDSQQRTRLVLRYLGDHAPLCNSQASIDYASLTPNQRAAAKAFARRGWALTSGTQTTFLPYRMKRHPIGWDPL